ncbi:biotin/lipoyl-containing protein [Youngiibacter multivorans]|uniref:Pyruvate dehydrogenase E2 component (Dihydrolipoamide acetyltransferase) n=1 Tax=Youngiibacter multivorans TaxID=937251 RepID=A0ABS4G5V4_9CLOT|nr:biotin/lipoyl-containing protein [Youngiibacter multivorans]MBP1919936.1 pyruvate dehydrogenase E2 component (dihydrolipoamide acetyltransferase) [Youngiibacter multivorans]
MVEKVIMPKLGMMEADIRLSEWLVKEGELVAEDQELCEVESQKITNQVKAKVSGTVLKLLVDEGEEVPIGTVIALLGEPGDDISEFS